MKGKDECKSGENGGGGLWDGCKSRENGGGGLQDENEDEICWSVL